MYMRRSDAIFGDRGRSGLNRVKAEPSKTYAEPTSAGRSPTYFASVPTPLG